MPDKTLQEHQLGELIAVHAGVPVDALRLSRCATGKFNTTYFVDGGPQPLVLRVAPPDDPSRVLFYEYRMMRQEPGLHARLRAKTDAPVPEIVASEFGHRRLDRDYLLMERLPGRPLSDHPGLSGEDIAAIFREVGRCLRQVHAIEGDGYGYAGEHAPMEPQPDWPSAFAIMWNRLLDDVERCGGYTTQEARFMRSRLDKHRSRFDRPVPASLLHMDVWAQNMLADNQGRLTGLVDWDRALWGDPEIEFAVLDYCGVSEPPFWEGYGRPRDHSEDALIRRQFYLLYEIQKYIFIRRVRSGSPRRADAYRRQSLEMAQGL